MAVLSCLFSGILALNNDDKEFSCPEEEGYYTTPECNTYYDCKGGRGTKKTCPNGLHFSRITRMCDWPVSSGCDKEHEYLKTSDYQLGEPTNEIECPDKTCHCLYPSPTDCSIYYRCTLGVPTKEYCAEGLYFDLDIGTCNLKENVQCDITSTLKTKTTTTIQPAVNNCIECGLYKDPENCRRFYQCSQGVSYHRWCPAGLHYNKLFKICDWPENACCGTNTSCSKPTPQPTQSQEGCNCECCFFPDEKDCAAYTYCEQGVLYKKRCSAGLYFNAKIGNCDLESNVDCQIDPKCPQPNGKFPIPGTTTYYLLCIKNIVRIEKCPEGLEFDPVTMCCTWPDTSQNKTIPGLIIYPAKKDCPCDCCVIPDPDDCTKFTLCINGNTIVQKCADGLRFNPKIENCDYAKNVDCDYKPTQTPVVRCEKSFGLFPHPSKCNQYIKCSDSIPDVKKCPSILHFNPNLRVCDWSWNAGCGKPYNKDPPPEGECDCKCCMKPVSGDCAAYFRCENRKKYYGRCTGGLMFNPKIETCDLAENVDCGDKPDFGFKCNTVFGLFSHPNNCTKFIQCANWRPHVKDCPSGLHFNNVLKRCDWPCIARCDPNVPVCPTETTSTTITTSGCNCEGCITPHPNDCSAYYICRNGHRKLLYCPQGFQFNSKINACDYPINVRCWKFVCPLPDGMFKNDNDCGSFWHCSNGIPHFKDCPANLHWSVAGNRCEWPCLAKCDPTVPTCPPSTTSKPIDPWCPCSKCLSEDPFDCQAFFKCNNGVREKKYCPTGLYFNRSTKVCDHLHNVECPDIGDPCLCKTPKGKFMFPEDCVKYVECMNGVAFIRTCPRGQKFDRSKQTCVSTNDDCGNFGKSPVCKERNGVFSKTGDCTRFYLCSNGIAYLKSCPSSLHFNPDLKVCDWPKNVHKCGIDQDTDSTCNVTNSIKCPPCTCRVPDLHDCGTFYQCTTNGIACKKTCPTGLRFNPLSMTCDLPKKCDCTLAASGERPKEEVSNRDTDVCKGQTSGMVRSPTNCSKFIHCGLAGPGQEQNCPAGLYFNENIQACDYKENVNC